MSNPLTEALERQLRLLRPDMAPKPMPVQKSPAPKNIKKVHLVFCEGTSDKEYNVEIVRTNHLYDVQFAYGRRGGTLQKGTKNEFPVSLGQAIDIFDTLVSLKKKKGYKEI